MDEAKAAALPGVPAREPERVGFTAVVDPEDSRGGHFKASQPQRVVASHRPSDSG